MLAELAKLGDIRPRSCLKLGPQAAVWAEVQGLWGRRTHRSAVRPLPMGLIKPSPVDPNISDMAALKDHLEALIRPQSSQPAWRRLPLPDLPRPTCLLLPDLCVRAAIIRLETLPARSEEQLALIRWRAAQEQLLPAAGIRVAFQVLTGGQVDGPTTVLAIAIRDAVLRQFESACEGVGLNPLEVDTVTLRLFNGWGLATGWFGRYEPADLLWVSVLDSGLTVLILHQGAPVYFRTKRLPQPAKSEFAPADWEQRIVEDVLASLASCADASPKAVPSRFILASDATDLHLLETLREKLALEGEELDWHLAEGVGWRAGNGHGGFAAVPAVAGVMGRM